MDPIRHPLPTHSTLKCQGIRAVGKENTLRLVEDMILLLKQRYSVLITGVQDGRLRPGYPV